MANGTDIAPWKMKKLIVPQNMNTAQDILAWLQSELANESYLIMMCARDNVDRRTWVSNDFIASQWGHGDTVNDAMLYLRNRGATTRNMYLQSRKFSDNEETFVYQGDKFTMLYQ